MTRRHVIRIPDQICLLQPENRVFLADKYYTT